MQFGLMFFAGSENAAGGDRYRLVIEGAKFADQHGFSSVWVPERHFTKFGCLYPNPSVLHAALARETKQIHLRAGSVVMPLHNPIRVAEEWAVVDNLSGGRVGIAFASGWHPNDFAFSPEKYADRHEETFRGIQTVQKLWQGASISVHSGDGSQIEVRIYPTPVQRTLPVWITAAGNPKTYERAGEIGANLLTALLDQDVEEVAEKISLYRESRARHGYDPATGHVTIMLHTHIGQDVDVVRERVRRPYRDYLKSIASLSRGLAYSRGRNVNVDVTKLSEQEMDDFTNFLFERFFSTRALLGTPETCVELVEKLAAIGVDEVACLVDFGVETDLILESLPYLNKLKERCAEPMVQHPRTQQANWLKDICTRCQEEISGPEFYNRLGQHSVQYGSSFRGIERLWRRDGEALGHIRLVEELEPETDCYHIHPALLDACLQVLSATLPAKVIADDGKIPLLPIGLGNLRVYHRPGRQVWSHALLRKQDANIVEGDVRLLDEAGRVVVEVRGFRLRFEPAAHVPANLDDWFYELQWQPQARLDGRQVPKLSGPGMWLIFADDSTVGKALASILAPEGEKCVLVFPGGAYEQLADNCFRICPERSQDVQQLLDAVIGSDQPECCGVVHLWSLNASPPEETTVASLERAQTLGCGSVLHLVQELARRQWREPPRLWLVTRGAQPAGQGSEPPAVSQAPLWGLGRVIAQEHPEIWGGLVDLDPEAPVRDLSGLLWEEICNPDGEDQIAFRQERRHVARLVRKRGSIEPALPLQWRPDGSYLITGGLSGLGLLVAQWMVQHGARHLVLMGRSGASATARETVKAMMKAGAQVVVVKADVTQAQQVAGVLAEIAQTMPPLRGIVHAASVLDDGILLQLNQERLQSVMAPKVSGAWNLHTLTLNLQLDFFIFFSSAASLLGSPGQGNFSAANAFLDALAHYRRVQRLPALSINWGPWSEVGQAAARANRGERLAYRGFGSISPKHGLEVLGRLLEQGSIQVGVVPFDWPQWCQFYPTASASPLFAHLAREQASISQRRSGPKERVRFTRDAVLAMEPRKRQQLLESYLSEQIAKVLGLASKVDVQQPLNRLGIDSLMAIELKTQAEVDLGIVVSLVSLLQGPSITQLAQQLIDQLKRQSSPPLVSLALVGTQSQEAQAAINLDASSNEEPTEQLLADINRLSDEEVDSWLSDILATEDVIE